MTVPGVTMPAMDLATIVDLLVPPVCLTCRAPGRDLCSTCRRDLPWLTGPRCPRCALPSPCGRPCPAVRQTFDGAWAPFAHDGPARGLVLALKVRRQTAAVDILAAAIVAGAPEGFLPPGGIVVPVPAHPGRRRTRGLDHARALADAVAARCDMPVAAGALIRAGVATRQVGGDRASRLVAATQHGVRPGRDAGRIRGAQVALVDDVHTTGATLDACTRVLRASGATRVVAVTAVRALG